MKQKRKGYRKFIFGGIAFALVIGIISADLFNSAAVAQAKQNTFHGMAPYQTTGKNGLSILEITPTANDRDFGYFVNPDPNRDQINQVADLTYGTLLWPFASGPELQAQLQRFRELKNEVENEAKTEAAEAAFNDPGLHQTFEDWKAQNTWFSGDFREWTGVGASWGHGQAAYNAVYEQKLKSLSAESLIQRCEAEGIDYDAMLIAENPDVYYAVILRRYGMIKPAGFDAVITNGDDKRNAVSEYPIFSGANNYPLFATADIENNFTVVNMPTGSMVSGHYELSPDYTGAYQLKDGYVLGDGSQATDAVDEFGSPVDMTLKRNYIYRKELYVDPDAGNDTDKDKDNDTDKDTDIDTDKDTDSVSGNDSGEPGDDSGETGDDSGETGTEPEEPEEPEEPDVLVQYIYTEIGDGNGLPEGVMAVDGGGNLEFIWLANKSDIYHGYSTEKLYFTNNADKKYRLGAWIKEYILGDATKNYNVSYTNATIDQINNGTYSLDNYDLIYISGRAEEYVAVNGDLSDDLVKQLYNASAINHKAVMMDYALFDAEKGQRNINNLALLLWQNDQKAIVEGNESYFSYDADDQLTGIDDIAGILGNAAIMNGLASTRLKGYNGNFAVNNVYVYNHHWSDFQSSKLEQFQNDALDVFANGDLNSQYTAAATAGGFQSVLAYISYNNTLSIEDGNGSMTEGYVTPAIAIQYILSYMGEDLALSKGKFVVLEIEPTKQFRFNSEMTTKDFALETAEVKAARNEFITKCLGTDIVERGMQDYVTFTSVTIDQYNTMQTDLIHDYDIVYIGDEFTSYFYTVDNLDTRVFREVQSTTPGEASSIDFESVKGTITAFNDANMYGNVYYNYGDAASATRTTIAQRYASRDLTKAKLTELKDYLVNRGLIVVDEDLMISPQAGNTIINPTASSVTTAAYYDKGRMDNSSNMYELFNFALGRTFEGTQAQGDRYQAGGTDGNGNPVGTYSNFVSMGDLGRVVDREDLLIYLNRERVTLNLISQPTSYVYVPGLSPSFVQIDNKDGKYYLECEFVIDNSTAVIAEEDVYQVRFYQDMNADGRFADTEEKPDFEISRSADGAAMPQVTGQDGVTQYNLNNGVAYKLRRAIPSDEGGIINWCIKVEKISNRDINCKASGFTAVRPREVKYLNILQIIPNSAATINLETILEEEDTELYSLLTDAVVAQNYVINVRTVTADQFRRDTERSYGVLSQTEPDSEAIWQKYFSTFERTDEAIYGATAVDKDKDKPMNVNMIILGFGDSEPAFTNSYPINAIKSFLESNRPVLTSNNVVNVDFMVSGNNKYNYNFLSDFGQDRYGYTSALYSSFHNNNGSSSRAEGSTIPTDYIIPRETTSRQAVAYTPGSERGNAYIIPYAFTNTVFAIRFRVAEENSYSFINTASVNNLSVSHNPWLQASHTYVERMNDGQISHYPYTINDGGTGALVSDTHAQFFQLDLDSDSDMDGNSDIVVWYTLGENADTSGNVMPGAGIYSSTPGDGINNYYIYNYGNVTFTGFGGKNEGRCTTEEKKLFVNTLIAAYESGLVNPTVSYYEGPDSNSSMLESIAVPYDANVTGNNAIDSSIQMNQNGTDYLYKFVNPNVDPASTPSGTMAYFKVLDTNLVKGDKNCKVDFYLGVEDNASHRYTWPDGTVSQILNLQLNDNTVVSVVSIPIDIHTADFRTAIGRSNGNSTTNPSLEVGTMYGFYVPMSYLNNRGSAEIYIKADTSYRVLSSSTGQYVDRPLGTAYDMFTIIKQDLLKLD